jgi:hypothetical protein
MSLAVRARAGHCIAACVQIGFGEIHIRSTLYKPTRAAATPFTRPRLLFVVVISRRLLAVVVSLVVTDIQSRTRRLPNQVEDFEGSLAVKVICPIQDPSRS